MAIVRLMDRPAIEVIDGDYVAPPGPWSFLGEPDVRARLCRAIAAVGRIEAMDDKAGSFLSTAFAIGPRSLLCFVGVLATRTKDKFRFVLNRGIGADGIRTGLSGTEFECEVVANVTEQFALLRAHQPFGITPLKLSPRADVRLDMFVALGFPANDSRNGPDALRAIFGDRFGGLRLMPGHVSEAPLDSRVSKRSRSRVESLLQHDASTTGGCGGAPLIDVETGVVLGVHHSGRYLEGNYATASWDLLNESEIVAAMETSHRASPRAVVSRNERARPALPDTRPVFEVRSGAVAADEGWTPWLSDKQALMADAIASVAQLYIDTQASSLGNCFRVGPRLALTSASVARRFVDGERTAVRLRGAAGPWADFQRSVGEEHESLRVRVLRPIFVHPYFDLALIELDDLAPKVRSASIEGRQRDVLIGTPIAVLAHPLDRQPMRVTPGTIIGVAPSIDTGAASLLHDCAIEPGAAGALVIALDSGRAIAVGGAGAAATGGTAQPLYLLTQDPKALELDICFDPDPRASWLSWWRSPRPATPSGAERDNDFWNVTQPLDFTRPELREIESKLIATISQAQYVKYHAENVGIATSKIDVTKPIDMVWRDTLVAAALAMKLRALFEMLAREKQYESISADLKRFLP